MFKFQLVSKLVCTQCKKFSLREFTTSELKIDPVPMPEGAEVGDEYPSDFYQMLRRYAFPTSV